MKILGTPNYLSPKIWFDGTDYSRIELNEGCTISSYVRFLTHDWSLYTIARGLGLSVHTGSPIGIHRPIRVGRYCFIGTCSVIMPGANIGEGVIVGAGSVVRGDIAPWTIIVGSPAVPVGDSRDFLRKNLEIAGHKKLLEELAKVFNKTASV